MSGEEAGFPKKTVGLLFFKNSMSNTLVSQEKYSIFFSPHVIFFVPFCLFSGNQQ